MVVPRVATDTLTLHAPERTPCTREPVIRQFNFVDGCTASLITDVRLTFNETACAIVVALIDLPIFNTRGEAIGATVVVGATVVGGETVVGGGTVVGVFNTAGVDSAGV